MHLSSLGLVVGFLGSKIVQQSSYGNIDVAYVLISVAILMISFLSIIASGLIITLLVIIILTIIGVIIFNNSQNKESEKNNVENQVENNEENYIYKITYYDDGIRVIKNDIKVFDDRIEIDTINICGVAECDNFDPNPRFKVLNYSKENLEKFKNYIANELKIQEGSSKAFHEDFFSERNLEVISSLFLDEKKFELYIEEYKYRIEYTINANLNYMIYFKDDNQILVKKIENNIDTYKPNITKEEFNTIEDYILKKVKEQKENSIFLKDSNLTKEEREILTSIIKK